MILVPKMAIISLKDKIIDWNFQELYTETSWAGIHNEFYFDSKFQINETLINFIN